MTVNVFYSSNVSHAYMYMYTQRPTRRVRLKTESKADDPWKLLDPHEPVKTEKKPHRKGKTLVHACCRMQYCITLHL